MAEPRTEIAASAVVRGQLRASLAEREQVIGWLKAAFVHGRLAKDEFELRVGRALTSRSCADLAALIDDIPVGLTGARPPQPARESGHKKVAAAVIRAIARRRRIARHNVIIYDPEMDQVIHPDVEP